MDERAWKDNFIGWLNYLPVRLAFRIIWLCARMGNATAIDIYKAMWKAELDLPVIDRLVTK